MHYYTKCMFEHKSLVVQGTRYLLLQNSDFTSVEAKPLFVCRVINIDMNNETNWGMKHHLVALSIEQQLLIGWLQKWAHVLHLLHLLHFDLEALDLGVQLLDLTFVGLSEGSHVLLRRVAENRQVILVCFLSARSVETAEVRLRMLVIVVNRLLFFRERKKKTVRIFPIGQLCWKDHFDWSKNLRQ